MRFKPRYKQLTIDGFRSSLDGLDKTNRWVWLGDNLPWEDYEQQYGQKLNNQTVGAGAKPARMVIGAMVIKHATRLSDVDTIQMIQENPHMQYLCGLEEFTDQPIFDPSLFVDLRKRISEDDINKMTESLLKREQEMKGALSYLIRFIESFNFGDHCWGWTKTCLTSGSQLISEHKIRKLRL